MTAWLDVFKMMKQHPWEYDDHGLFSKNASVGRVSKPRPKGISVRGSVNRKFPFEPYTNPQYSGRYSKNRAYSKRNPRYRTAGFYGRYNNHGEELKFHDGTKACTVVASSGTVLNNSLNIVAQGTTESTRIGRHMVIKKIHLRGFLYLVESTAKGDTADRVRIIIGLDTQANGAAATIAQILTTAAIDSFRNLQYHKRFRILYDKFHTIHAQVGGGNGTTEDYGRAYKNFKFHKNCNIDVIYDDITGAITEQQGNNIFVMAISESGDVQVCYDWRLRFAG